MMSIMTIISPIIDTKSAPILMGKIFAMRVRISSSGSLAFLARATMNMEAIIPIMPKMDSPAPNQINITIFLFHTDPA